MNQCRLTVSRHNYARVRSFDDGNQLPGELEGTIVVHAEPMVIDVIARHSRVICTSENSGTQRQFARAYPDAAKPCCMNLKI